MTNQQEQVQNTLQALLSKMGCSGEIDVIEYHDGVHFTIKTRDGGLLIGENGQNLIALNHLVRKITDRLFKKEEQFRFSIDVNDYQRQRHESLRDLARMSAQRVRYFKKEVVMDPMTSYDRRIIHSALTEYPDIITESTGEEPERRIVIKPYNP